jgi:hypothetical protein
MDTFDEEIFGDLFLEGTLTPLFPKDEVDSYEDFIFSMEDLQFLEESSCSRKESNCVHIR